MILTIDAKCVLKDTFKMKTIFAPHTLLSQLGFKNNNMSMVE